VVLDLFSRQVIGWSMKPQMTSDLAIDALLMAVWRRKPKQEVMIHSDSKNVLASVSMWSDSDSDRPMMDDLVVECPEWPDPHSDRPLCLSPDLSTAWEHCTSR
jgi:putative transposase